LPISGTRKGGCPNEERAKIVQWTVFPTRLASPSGHTNFLDANQYYFVGGFAVVVNFP